MDSSSDALEPVELLADEFMERQRKGENPTIDEYVERHPELADEIRDVFPALAVIEQIAPASADLEQSQISHDSPAHVRISQIGDYRILREIGRGGMGVVYEAEQQSLRRRVALKVLPRQIAGDQKALKRFQQEARAAARMHHTNIVPVFEVGDDDEHVFYAMQLIQGQGLDLVIDDLQRLRNEHSGLPASQSQAAALADRSHANSIAASLVMGEFEQQNLIEHVQQSGNTSPHGDNGSEEYNATVIAETKLFDSGSTASAVLPGQSEISSAETDRGGYYLSVARIGHQTAGALAYAHARGIIHRDIKPSNLLLDTAGVVWVTDFGLAKTGDETLTHTGDILGTLRYMSPERFKGQCDVRADVYSLGLTLYELLVLKPAFSSPDRLKLIELVTKSEPPTPRSIDPRIPRDLETIVLKSIDKDPRRRYPTSEDLADDLERFIHDEPIHARRISLAERFGRWARRNKSLATSLTAMSVMLVVIAVGSVLAAGYYRQMEQQASADAASNAELAAANRQLADDKEVEAANSREQEALAVAAREELERELYVSDMRQVRLAYQEGALDRMVELLNRHIPLDDKPDQRGWEWYYWWRASRLHTDQFRSGAPFFEIAVAPDNSWVAVRKWFQQVAIFDPQTMKQVVILAGCHEGPFETQIAVSPDGAYLATIRDDGTHVKLWRTDDWSELPALQHERQIKAIVFSSTGLLAAADAEGRVTFWDAEQQSPHGPPLETGQSLGCVSFSPDGSQLATADGVAVTSEPRGLLLWNVADHEPTLLVEGVSNVTALRWTEHAGRRLIAAGFLDGAVRLWDAETGSEFDRMSAGGPVQAIAFSGDGSRVAATTSRNNAVQVWETGSGRQIATIRGHARTVGGVCFGGDNETVWSSSQDGKVKRWALARSEPFRRMQAPADPDRRRTVTFGADGLSLWRYQTPVQNEPLGDVHRWNVNTGEELAPFEMGEGAIVAAISDEGNYFALIRENAAGQFVLETWRTDLAQPALASESVLPDDANRHRPEALTVSRDGAVIAWPSGSNVVTFDMDTNRFQVVNIGPGISGPRVTLSPDGMLMSVPRFPLTPLWGISGESPVLLGTVGTFGPAYNVRFSRRGDYLAIASWNNDVFVVECATGLVIHQFSGHSGSAWALDFSPDDRLLASGGFDGTVRLWDLDPQYPGLRLTLSAHATEVTSVAFSQDGRAIASVSADGETRIWTRAADGDLLRDLEYWTYRAETYEERQDWDAALAEWTTAIQHLPTDPSCYERRGDLHVKRERFAEALSDYQEAVSRNGEFDFNKLSIFATWSPVEDVAQTSDSSWRFTLDEPDGDWRAPDFDDADWGTGGPRFATDPTGKDWPQRQIWLRREFDLREDTGDMPEFLIYANDDVTIYVNGHEAATAHWSAPGNYQIVPSTVPLKAGRNVIAVHCDNSGGHSGGVHVVPGRRNSGEALIDLLSAALNADPANQNLLVRRAEANVRLERWHDAALDFEQLAALESNGDSLTWMRAVTLHAVAVVEGSGEIDDYRRVANAMIERFHDSIDLGDIERTLKVCTLLTADLNVDRLPVDRIRDALRAGTVRKVLVPWFNIACAISAYRSGDLSAAGQYAQHAFENAAPESNQAGRMHQHAASKAIASLALSATGKANEAEEALRMAMEAISAGIQYAEDGTIVGASVLNDDGTVNHDLLIAAILIREAEQALERR